MDLEILAKLCECFSGGSLSEPSLGASYILDKHGEIIGHFDFSSSRIYINQEYRYAGKAIAALKEHKLEYEIKKYEKFEVVL